MNDELNSQYLDASARRAALACRTCEAPATVHNVSGKEECLCEEHYRQELAVYNDFWNT